MAKAYLLVRVTIRDVAAYQEYMKHTPRIIDAHGGRMIVRGGEADTMEGPKETQRHVIIEFPSSGAARAFYDSEDYAAAKALREGAGEAQFVILERYAPESWEDAVLVSRGELAETDKRRDEEVSLTQKRRDGET
ncbi:DUF1330 domain-containing protein [Verrucomicrobiales bacterium]|jgi:uncharacterized protein (DUF1330 family)|nr:DUF1330 domain-containing protein [Verrucomicrobiales bacterium]